MSRRILGAILLLAALSLGPRAAWAWSNQGHMATGELAYDDLMKTDPGAAAMIVALSGALPRRSVMDAGVRGATGAARDRLIFAYLARWPDDIRGTPLDRPVSHYRLRGVSPIGAMIPYQYGDAETTYRASLATLRDSRAAARDRAIAAAWLFHIVGDMHQPLHAATWLSWRFPKTDRAGTIAYVRPAPNAAPMTLHDFWDNADDQPGDEAAGAAAISADLERRFPRARLRELGAPPDRFSQWSDESAALALKSAYRNGALAISPDPARAPVLSPAYLRDAQALAQRRIAIASYRLADIVRTALQGR